MRQLYEEKDKKLLLLSGIIDDYSSLKSFLEAHKKPTSDDLKDCDAELRGLFENNLFSEIVLQARSEWHLQEGVINPLTIYEYQKTKRECQYCGQPNLKYVYFIENVKNNSLLEVGSTCVVDLGIKSKKEMDDIERNAKRLNRLTDLNNQIPGIEGKVDSSKKLLEKSEILIAEAVSKEYLQNSREIWICYNEYLDPKTTDKKAVLIPVKLKQLLAKHERLETGIAKYISQNQRNPLVAKKKYLGFLRENPDGREQMIQAGFVGKLAILSIAENEFMKGLFPKLNDILQDYNIKAFDTHGRSYLYTVAGRSEIFYIPHDHLISFIAEGIYDEPLSVDFDTKSILAQSAFNDDKSYHTAISWLVEKTVYAFDFNRQLKEIIFYPKENQEKMLNSRTNIPNAILHKWDAFVSKFSVVMLTRDGLDLKDLVEYIFSGDRIVFAEHQNMDKDMQRPYARLN